MRKLQLLVIAIIIFMTTQIFGAAFRQLSPLINIPTAKTFKAGDVEFLAAVLANTSVVRNNKKIHLIFNILI